MSWHDLQACDYLEIYGDLGDSRKLVSHAIASARTLVFIQSSEIEIISTCEIARKCAHLFFELCDVPSIGTLKAQAVSLWAFKACRFPSQWQRQMLDVSLEWPFGSLGDGVFQSSVRSLFVACSGENVSAAHHLLAPARILAQRVYWNEVLCSEDQLKALLACASEHCSVAGLVTSSGLSLIHI